MDSNARRAAAPRVYVPPFIVETILPTRQVHLIAGTSGIGKTTFLLQWLADIQVGIPFFNYASRPVSYCVVSCHRSAEHIEQTNCRIGLDGIVGPIVDLKRTNDGAMRERIVTPDDLLKIKEVERAELIVLEGIETLLPPSANERRAVTEFMQSLLIWCDKHGKTVIGTHGATKTAQNHRLIAAREKLCGTSAWAHLASTIVFIEPWEWNDPTNPYRRIEIHSMQAAMLSGAWLFDARGRLVYQERGVPGPVALIDEKSIRAAHMQLWLLDHEQFTRAELSEYAHSVHMTVNMLERWIKESLHSGLITRTGHGMYARTAKAKPAVQ